MSVVLGLLIAGAVALPRAADPVLVSGRLADGAAVDGRLLEWPKLDMVSKGLQVGVANDAAAVYVAVLATDPVTRVSLAGGVVLWIDPTGDHKETFGLQLPGPPPIDPASVSRSATGGVRLTPIVSDHIDVLGPGRYARRLVNIEPGSGLAVATGGEDGGIAFEVRIPFGTSSAGTPALVAGPGRSFSLAVATPERRKGPREPMEPIIFPDPYESLRIRGLYYGNGQTVPLPDSREKDIEEVKPKNIKIWSTVKLAS